MSDVCLASTLRGLLLLLVNSDKKAHQLDVSDLRSGEMNVLVISL